MVEFNRYFNVMEIELCVKLIQCTYVVVLEGATCSMVSIRPSFKERCDCAHGDCLRGLDARAKRFYN
jgi:hypothetical protein